MRRFIVYSILLFLISCKSSEKKYTISNSRVSASFSAENGFLVQEYAARKAGAWQPVVKSASAVNQSGLSLYDTGINKTARYLLSNLRVSSFDQSEKDGSQQLIVGGTIHETRVNMVVTLADTAEHFHLVVEAEITDENPSVEYILSDYEFIALTGIPEFVHTPALKFVEEDIVGDRTFWSPALILQQQQRFVALVPDLDLINANKLAVSGARPVATGHNFSVPPDSANITFPTGFDLHSGDAADSTMLFSYGFIDALATHHMHWVHPSDSSMVHKIGNAAMKFGFHLFVSSDAERYAGYQPVSRFIWERYGTKEFNRSVGLTMPFEKYAALCYDASARYEGSQVVEIDGKIGAAHNRGKDRKAYASFLTWDMQGVPVGGYRNNAPQWYDMIGNTTWWNNVRDAVGMFRWSERLKDTVLKDRARRVINLALQAPQRDGAFPVIYSFDDKRWIGNHWNPPMDLDSSRNERYFDDNSRAYHSSSMSKTALHLLKYYANCEQRPEILQFAENYGRFLHKHAEANGCVPDFFTADLKPNPHLRENAAGGIHIWFLAQLYALTGNEDHLRLADVLAGYLVKEVLPAQVWKDFEVYLSCGVKPMNFYDHFTSQPPRNTLSMYWAVEGFTALFEVTNDKKYLAEAEKVADYLSFYQAAWQPHFITTAYAFGGFGVQNTDAEWLDARQGEIAPALLRLGVHTRRQDLVEKGLAAANSSLVLINHETHVKDKVYAYPNFPYGLGPENIDHEGFPQSPMRTNAGWGEVSGLSGIADILAWMDYLHLEKPGQATPPFNKETVREIMSVISGSLSR